MSEEQVVGERRRRREAERAAEQAAGAEQEQPLTRREIRAREAALQTGELKIDETGELRVIADPPPPVLEPDAHLDGPATGMIGMTRRQLRELREQQAAAAAATGAVAAGSSGEAPAKEERPAAPAPPVRRPIVRPPASAGSVRSLTEDGTALAPPAPSEGAPSDPSSPATWSTGAPTSVDVTGSLPAVAAEPEPSSPSREKSLSAEASAPEEVEPSASLDELIAGETQEPEPFSGKPSWAELPPSTPGSPMAEIATAEPSAPPADGSTEVIDIPPEVSEVEASAAVEPATGNDAAELLGSGTGEVDGDDDDDGDEEDHDDHRTPRWLTALMWLVLVVIGIVLGLLIWQLVRGEGSASATAAIWQGGAMTRGLRS